MQQKAQYTAQIIMFHYCSLVCWNWNPAQITKSINFTTGEMSQLWLLGCLLSLQSVKPIFKFAKKSFKSAVSDGQYPMTGFSSPTFLFSYLPMGLAVW